MRYSSNYNKDMTSLDDYIKKMKPGQNKIYFVTGATKELAMANPFMEIFKHAERDSGPDAAPPVLLLTNNADEFCF
jgi:molecular chaperone HtpG